MNTYRITGTDRDQHAIGAMERFTATVRATSPKQALTANQTARYQAGRDHVLAKKIEVKTGRVWVNIPMLEALELE